MSGNAGLLDLDGAPAPLAILRRIGDTLARRGRDAVRWVSGPVAMSRRPRPLRDDGEGLTPAPGATGPVLAWDGRLDNRGDLLSHLRLPAATPDIAVILAAYRRWGDRMVERL